MMFLSVNFNDDFGSMKFNCGGIMPVLRTRSDLISPAIPADASRCPMLDFTEPTYRSSSRFRPSQKTE